MRRTLTLCRTGLAGVAAVVLLTACNGGSSNDSSASSASEATSSSATSATATSASTSAAPDPEAAAFCQQVVQVFGQLQSAAGTTDPTQSAQLIQQVVAAFDQVTPPAVIQADWATLGDALRQLASTAPSLDLSPPEGQQQLQQAEQQLTTQVSGAQGNVSQYVATNCTGQTTPTAT